MGQRAYYFFIALALASAIAAHAQDILSRPLAGDAAAVARFKLRKEQSGIAHRDEITCFVDYIDADEKRI